MSATDSGVDALGYVGIGASDPAAWERFAAILGLQLRERDADGTLRLRIDDQVQRIAVHPDSCDDLVYAGWEVANERALSAFAERLRASAIPFETADPAACRERRVGGMLRLRDPAGLPTEIYWGARVDRLDPFRSPRAIAGFETGEQGLGHVVVAVDDFAAALHFYRDVLGMGISDFIEFERLGVPVTMAFLHCNERHHSFAFMQLAHAPRRLSHLMLELRSLDDVGRTLELCEREAVPLTMTLGRHTNDHMLSFYVQSPSGFNVECGWGGRRIDARTWRVETHLSASMWGHRRPSEGRTG